MSQTIDWIPLFLIFPISLIVILIAMEFGFRFGRWRRSRKSDEKEGPIGTMVGAMLALLGFILAFTFGIAATQFDTRRQTIVNEANAVGTAYLRASMLTEPHASACKELLHQYVEVRESGVDRRQVREAIERSEAIQVRLWNEAKAAAIANPQQVPTGLFIEALNDVIDHHTLRMGAGLYARVPSIVWLTLLGLTAVSMGAVGYTTGLGERSRSWASVGLAVAFAGVIYLVADIDRPGEGTLQSQRWAMEELLRSMSDDESAPPTRSVP